MKYPKNNAGLRAQLNIMQISLAAPPICISRNGLGTPLYQSSSATAIAAAVNYCIPMTTENKTCL